MDDGALPETSVELLPLDGVEGSSISALAAALRRDLGVPVTVGRAFVSRGEWRASDGRGWRPDAILDSLERRARSGHDSTGRKLYLAIAEAPLIVAGQGEPFGQATIGGCCAVVTLAPLGELGHPLRHQRLLKEAIHELGHVCGLLHCPDPSCVMYPSADLATTDRKSPAFCARCAGLAGRCFLASSGEGSP